MHILFLKEKKKRKEKVVNDYPPSMVFKIEIKWEGQRAGVGSGDKAHGPSGTSSSLKPHPGTATQEMNFPQGGRFGSTEQVRGLVFL